MPTTTDSLHDTSSNPVDAKPCDERARTVPEREWNRVRLKVSDRNGEVLAYPALEQVPGDVVANAELLQSADLDLQGRSFQELRTWARQEILKQAVSYTSKIRDEDVALPDLNLLIADGHQPQLFHPGVWAKNFTIGGLAKKLDAVSLHLIVDNDAFSSCAIQVPTGGHEELRLLSIPFDRGHPANRPWEGAPVRDRGLFSAFAADVQSVMHSWEIEPELAQIWPIAIENMNRNRSLPTCLTAARHALEREWGLDNLEVPLSRICDTKPFFWFAAHLLAHLPCFRELYNEVLDEYRSANRVRSHTHPVPELKEQNGWLEAPFWIWREGEYQRGRLFARQTGNVLQIAQEDQLLAELKLSAETDAEDAVGQLAELRRQGYRLRTRALTTTLFARLFLADLFVHGIGGAKYDEMTDRLIARFFGIAPPAFLALSATHHLTFPHADENSASSIGEIQQRLRTSEFNPERHLDRDVSSNVQQLIAEKQTLIDEQQRVRTGERLGHSRREHHRKGMSRFRRLQDINTELRAFAGERRTELSHDLERAREFENRQRILKNREFSFCLFPEEALKEPMTRLAELE
ncbi:MAG TPA: hypothetical protein VMM56_16120 [Planctomycetaceae bacterium]|nr:hypothetical protein [Planctomycetaceae bacterium]